MNLLVDQVIVINLKSRPDRKKQMRSNLHQMGFTGKKIKFIEATTRDEESWKKALKELGYQGTLESFLPKSVQKRINSKRLKTRNYTRGQIGNFLSHLRCWSMVGKMKGFKNVMVLEDDVCPTKYWFDKNSIKLLKMVSNDYQLIYFGDCFKRDEMYLPCILKQGGNQLVRQMAECNHACLVNTTFGRIINASHDKIFPLKLPTDSWLPDFLYNNRIVWFNFKKNLLIQDLKGPESDIGFSSEDFDEEHLQYKCKLSKYKRKSNKKSTIKRSKRNTKRLSRKKSHKLNKKQAKFSKVLLRAKKALGEAGIPFHLHSGTALGALREKQFIEHDRDIDLGVFVKDYKKNLVPHMLKNGFTNYDENGTLKRGKEFTFYNKEGVDLDIFLIYEEKIPKKLFKPKSRKNEPTNMYWVASYYGICDNMRYGMCRWVYRPYKPVKVVINGEEYMSMPKKTMVDAYGKDWMTPREFDYFEGMEKDLYKGMVREPKE